MIEIPGAVQIPYTCDHCGRVEYRPLIHPKAGTPDDSARVAGWRVGATPAKPRVVWCPACAGTEPGYWARLTAEALAAVGLDVGRTEGPP